MTTKNHVAINNEEVCRSSVTMQLDGMPLWQQESPNLRFKELLKFMRMSKSKAYELIKGDPNFPKGIPLYDGDRSPKIYRLTDALAWIEMRSNKRRGQ